MEILKKIIELTELLNKASVMYYTYDNPIMDDLKYDLLYKELEELELKYPEYKQSNSPTNRVGSSVLSIFKKVKHDKKMMSLKDAFNYDELISFDEKIRKVCSDYSYICELKIDGLSCSLKYENGKLIQGLTRGDGYVGEDITNNVMTIKTVPLSIENKNSIEVRGEIYMRKSVLKSINEEREQQGLTLLQNTRNAASGSVRQLDSKLCSKRNLDMFLYYYLDDSINTQEDVLIKLKELGFIVNDKYKKCKNINEVISYIENINSIRESLDYDIDGIVIKVNEYKYHELIGYTNKTPKWAIAYKFTPEKAITRLLDVTFQIGRTGVLTPVGIFDAVFVSGSTVKKATLHNESYINDLDLKINDYVYIHKAGDIIPEVQSVLKDKRDNTVKEIIFPVNCPSCDSKLEKINDEFYCININCVEKRLQSIIHFCSKPCLNIVSLGDKVIRTLYANNIISTISDLFRLEEKEELIVNLEGFGKKSFDKIIESVNESKKVSLDKLISALGIKEVGSKTASVLAKHYMNLDNLINATYEELLSLSDIGQVTAKTICDFFKIDGNLKLIEELRSFNVNFNYDIDVTTNKFFTDKKIVITGTLTSYKRDELKDILISFGADITSKVTNKTDYLICGIEAGSKLDDAKKIGTRIIYEDELLKLLEV